MTVDGARETVGKSVGNNMGIQCFNSKGFLGQLCQGNSRKPKRGLKTLRMKRLRQVWKQLQLLAKILEDDQNAAECVDERVALANLIANLTLDMEENKTVLKQLKKANASLTQELKECKTNLDESSRALGEATSSRDSSLIALQTKQTELEKYTALNDLTSDYKILQTKLNDTLGLLAIKNIDIKEGLKTKTYEISVVNQKHDELVKKSLLNRPHSSKDIRQSDYGHSDPVPQTKCYSFSRVRQIPSQQVQTRRQLATDPEICMFVLTVSIVEPKNIKEAMADSAMDRKQLQDELHQFERTKRLKRVMILRNLLHQSLAWKQFGFSLPTKHSKSFPIYQMDRKTAFLNMVHEGGGVCCSARTGSLIQIIRKVYLLRKAVYGLSKAPRAVTMKLSNPDVQRLILKAKYAFRNSEKHILDQLSSIGYSIGTKPKIDVDLSGGSRWTNLHYRSKNRVTHYRDI
ncbi:hypothetical protein Tco_0351142 [Tanacetum coccineum]